MNVHRILKWVGPETWVLTASGEIQIKPEDLLYTCGDGTITTGFMVEKIPNESEKIILDNTITYKCVSGVTEYDVVYQEDLQRRNPHAPVICTVEEDLSPKLQSSKARELASKFGITFVK